VVILPRNFENTLCRYKLLLWHLPQWLQNHKQKLHHSHIKVFMQKECCRAHTQELPPTQRTSLRGQLTIWVYICPRLLISYSLADFFEMRDTQRGLLSPLSFPLDSLLNKTDDVCKSQNTVPLKPCGYWQAPTRWLRCAAFREWGRVLVRSYYLSLPKMWIVI